MSTDASRIDPSPIRRVVRAAKSLTKCPVCGRRTKEERHEYANGGPHASPIFDDVWMLRCVRCDSMWTPSPPSEGKLNAYYSTSYTPARMGNIAKDQWPIWDTRAASLISLARMFVPFEAGETFIDVGPGNGASLSLAPLMLPSPKLGCVEFNEKSIEFFRRHIEGIRITQTIEDFKPKSAAIIYSAHSLEHYGPAEALPTIESIRDRLRPGGALTLEVPYSPSRRTNASYKATPHLIFFSKPGLIRLVERAGLKVRLCEVFMGRTQSKPVARKLAPPDSLSPRFSAALRALNTADMIAQPPTGDDPVLGTLKLVAVRE